MNKNITNLTKQEKINFCLNDNNHLINKTVKDYNKSKKFRRFLTYASAIANATLVALCIAMWTPYSPLFIACAIGAFALPTVAINFHHKLWLNRLILNYSNNKIGLKEYENLQKSGELAKWHEDYYEEIVEANLSLQNIQTEDYVSEINNTTLMHETQCSQNSTTNKTNTNSREK